MSRRLELLFKRFSKTFVCSIVFVIMCCSAFYAKADTGFYAENDSQIDKNRLFYIDVCYDSSFGVSSAIININFDGDMAVFKSVKDENDETVIKAREDGSTITVIYADCSEDKNDQRLFTLCLKSLKEGNFDINISCEELVEKNSSDYQISQVGEKNLCNVAVNEKSVSVKTSAPAHSSKNKSKTKNKGSKSSGYDSESFEDEDYTIDGDEEVDKIDINSKNNDIVRFTVIIVIVVFIGFVAFYFVIERKLKKIKNKDKEEEDKDKDRQKDIEKEQDGNKEDKI